MEPGLPGLPRFGQKNQGSPRPRALTDFPSTQTLPPHPEFLIFQNSGKIEKPVEQTGIFTSIRQQLPPPHSSGLSPFSSFC